MFVDIVDYATSAKTIDIIKRPIPIHFGKPVFGYGPGVFLVFDYGTIGLPVEEF